MSGKLIIENRTELDMGKVLSYVAAVVNLGKVSNNNTQYCYGTSFEGGVIVYSDLNKNSDKLIVTYKSDDTMQAVNYPSAKD